jgi:glycosyltransferase involved in cell wall biosynthesis
MRSPVRKIAFIGTPEAGVQEALVEFGYRIESTPGDSIMGLAREMHRVKPAVIHARRNLLKAGIVARLFDLPLLVQAERDELTSNTAQAARMASRTLCGGASVREALIGLGAPAQSTCILRGLVDVQVEPRSAAVFPPILDSAIRFVVAASPCDGPDRGHQDLLIAFLSLARTRPGLKLLIAGDGPEADKLRAQADHAGMLNRVVVHDISLPLLPAVFSRAVAVVGPSRSGNWPDPIPEALAAGAPVVATAIGAHPAWVREGRTGWLVPPRAPAALAARLAHVIDDRDAAKKVGAQARSVARDQVAPRAVAQELARCYAAIGRLPAMPGHDHWVPRLQGA